MIISQLHDNKCVSPINNLITPLFIMFVLPRLALWLFAICIKYCKLMDLK